MKLAVYDYNFKQTKFGFQNDMCMILLHTSAVGGIMGRLPPPPILNS